MDNNITLTEREKKVIEYMRNWVRKKGYPPTVREICRDLNIKSTSTVHKTIACLEEKGLVRKDPDKRRAVEILWQNNDDADSSSLEYSSHKYSSPTGSSANGENVIRPDFGADLPPAAEFPALAEDVISVPVVGNVAAGQPILAEQNIEETFPLPSRFINGGTHFMLRVKGDSMVEAGIFDGDFILVRSQNTARNGEIVVAMVEGHESEATVKTFFKEDDHIRLQPENSSMDPIIVPDAAILGLVKGVFRYFQ